MISVIIPVYNVESYIKQCLASVCSQTYKNIEIICVDDCGGDNSMSIVEKCACQDRRIKIVRHKENKGLGASRNTGIDAAKGQYIFFLDSDDYIAADASGILEKLLRCAKHTASDIVISKTRIFLEDPEDRFLLENKQFLDRYFDFELMERYVASDICAALSKISAVAWGRLFSADFLKQNEIYFINENIVHEDEGFNIKVFSNSPTVSLIGDIGVTYRQRKDSIMAKMTRYSQRRKRKYNTLASLNDAFEYIRARFSKEKAEDIIQSVKFRTPLSWCFDKYINLCGIIRIEITVNFIRIRIFGISVLKLWKKPKISIIVPFYNLTKSPDSENILRRNIEALIFQKYKNIEIIYVCDSLTDDLRRLIESYNDPRIVIYESDQGVSFYALKDLGIERAHGKYITFVGGDDYIGRNMIKRAACKLRREPDILIGDFTAQTKDGVQRKVKTFRERAIEKYGNNIKDIYGSIEYTHNIFFKTFFIHKYNIRYTDNAPSGESNLFNVTAISRTNRVEFYES
ncbi:MAG: glycosyltransferase [Helicobacteraceae bacterium]|jgi:glycosyltransferase involved in cell wall biosynthesis|nr:glycosyltransferase [Helicobacteraceae bacterium]